MPFFLSLLLAPFFLVTHQDEGYVFSVTKRDEVMEQCVQGGLPLRYRFDVQVCRSRALWFDSCKGERNETHEIRYDPITEQYRVTRDRMDDGIPPQEELAINLDEAFAKVTDATAFSPEFLAHGDLGFLRGKRVYISVRARVQCKEEESMQLERVSEGISLGLVPLERFDSGWKKIPLER